MKEGKTMKGNAALPQEKFHCVWVCIHNLDLAVFGLFGVVSQHRCKHGGSRREVDAVHGKGLVLANDCQVRQVGPCVPK